MLTSPGGAGPRPASLPQVWFHAGLVEVENVHVKVVRKKEKDLSNSLLFESRRALKHWVPGLPSPAA